MRTVHQAFDAFLQRLTPTAAQRSAGASHRKSVYDALCADLPLVSMFESGSFSHGTGVRSHSDTDVFAWLKWDSQPAYSWDALATVLKVLKVRFPRTPVYLDPPAVAVDFGGGYERWEVIPAYTTTRGNDAQSVFQIPSHQWVGGWIYSAPKVHLAYVDACNEKPTHGDAKALARLIKAWKYFNEVPISSFYLEMRCAEFVTRLTSFIPIFDVSYLFAELNADALAPIPDPSGLTDAIQPCADDDDLSAARDAVARAAMLARGALDQHLAKDASLAFAYLSLLFNKQFPSQYDG